uniref:Uncharacterized protein n=1 Tax=Arundo donax TaxID=35708 RepID=A0A0A9A1Z7_ARUDO
MDLPTWVRACAYSE